MTAVDPEGRIRHPLDVFHSTLAPDGSNIPAGMVPVADGLGQVDYVNATSIGLGWFDVTAYGALGDGATDDTAGIQAAIDACAAAGGGTVYFPAGVYIIGGALQDSGAFNGQILFPSISTSDPAITIRLLGALRPSFSAHALPLDGWSVLKSTLTGASGTAAVFSGGNGSYPGTKNNVSIVLEDLISLSPDNPTASFWNLAATQAGSIRNLLIHVASIGTGSYTEPTHSNSYGIKLPQVRNSNYQHVDGLFVGVHYTGVLQGELAIDRGLIFGLCKVAVEFPGPGEHASLIVDVHGTGCTTMFKASGLHYCDILAYDFETTTGPAWSDIVYDLDDASNYLHGAARYWGFPNPPTHTFTKNGGTNFSAVVIGALSTTAALDDLSDVTITSPAANNRLVYNGTAWVNSAAIWRPLMDGAGAVVTDGATGEAVMVLS